MTETSAPLALLEKQIEQLESLLHILQLEHEILQQHDPEALINVTEKKNDLLLAIQTLDQQIGTSQEFIKGKYDGLFNDEINTIEVKLDKCKEKNEVNGMIIQHSQLAVERMKSSLLENNNRSSVTYNNKGKKSGGLTSIGIKA